MNHNEKSLTRFPFVTSQEAILRSTNFDLNQNNNDDVGNTEQEKVTEFLSLRCQKWIGFVQTGLQMKIIKIPNKGYWICSRNDL